jgi:DNA-binding CsgD family transcriptional regulator
MGRSRIFLVQVSSDDGGGWSAQASPLGAATQAGQRFTSVSALAAYLAGEGAPRAPARSPLTGRESEIGLLFAAGSKHKQIAQSLGLAPSTVRNHLSACYRKLGVDNRSALLAALTIPLSQGDDLVHLHHGAPTQVPPDCPEPVAAAAPCRLI